MKAKEYAERFSLVLDKDDELYKIVYEFILEVKSLCGQRRVRSDESLISVIKEVNDKWVAFARMSDGLVNPDGFRLYLLKCIPTTREIHDRVWPGKVIPSLA